MCKNHIFLVFVKYTLVCCKPRCIDHMTHYISYVLISISDFATYLPTVNLERSLIIRRGAFGWWIFNLVDTPNFTSLPI